MTPSEKTASTRDSVLAFINGQGSATSAELVGHLGITRQAINLHLRALINSGQIIKTGTTKAARYLPESAIPGSQKFSNQLDLTGLQESEVYDRVAISLNLSQLRPNVESIVHYAFTEILNNAIDHSTADRCNVEVRLDAGKLSFTIGDRGIGAFKSIADKYDLPDEQAAMIELVKGKTTTMPEAHTGEGIFFVSKVADRFFLRSHRIQLEWNRALHDVFVSTPKFKKGTFVRFEIQRDSRTKLENVFEKFAPEAYDYKFQKTRVQVKLLQKEYVSRSEAKRLTFNLHKFSEVELDMVNVRNVGQGFTDEVFRVFASEYPDVRIRTVNASKNIAAMIRHARGPSAG
jgi:anti-sigma regulatory factor (Ser/Thr protein kinase)